MLRGSQHALGCDTAVTASRRARSNCYPAILWRRARRSGRPWRARYSPGASRFEARNLRAPAHRGCLRSALMFGRVRRLSRRCAIWPEAPAREAKRSEYAISPEQRRFWAFQPVRSSALPVVRDRRWRCRRNIRFWSIGKLNRMHLGSVGPQPELESIIQSRSRVSQANRSAGSVRHHA
jgi:hypothetical protein